MADETVTYLYPRNMTISVSMTHEEFNKCLKERYIDLSAYPHDSITLSVPANRLTIIGDASDFMKRKKVDIDDPVYRPYRKLS